MEKVKRNGVIDFMRFVFGALIVLYHCRYLGGGSEHALIAGAGYIGVEFFFLVSGFLMAKSVFAMPESEQSIGYETIVFIWKKIRSVLPYYLFAVFFSYCGKVYTNDYTLIETIRNFLLGIWDLAFLRASGIKGFELIRATWYLSAMYLAMFILFPMLRRWKTTYTRIIAPLLSIFLIGYLTQTCDNLNQYINNWNIFYPGLIRAVAEISLGCICFEICEKMKSVSYTLFTRILITLGQVLGYSFIIYCMHDLPGGSQFDFVLVPILAFCVILSFSGQGVCVPMFSGKVFPWLGKMSLIIYLNHMWVKDGLAALLPVSLGYWKLLGICLGCIAIASLCCMFFVDGIGKLVNKNRDKIYRCFVKI